jgi:SAM-dependent methyltransferase
MPPGFKRRDLRARYDVATIDEDDWHAYTGERTKQILDNQLTTYHLKSIWLLNAGAGVYEIGRRNCKEVSVDLFTAPIRDRPFSICANVEHLPFHSSTFGAIVCVGEVLAYCDPAAAIREFARVIAPCGLLICDFASSRSTRYWLRPQYGRAADLVTEYYNGTREKTWIYDPPYVKSLLISSGFEIKTTVGTHAFSALARRIGVTVSGALYLQRRLEWLRVPRQWSDLITIVAEQVAS